MAYQLHESVTYQAHIMALVGRKSLNGLLAAMETLVGHQRDHAAKIGDDAHLVEPCFWKTGGVGSPTVPRQTSDYRWSSSVR